MRNMNEIRERMDEYSKLADEYYDKAKECEMNGDSVSYWTYINRSDTCGSYANALKWALGELDY